jgi:hypothetical protein
MPMFLLAVEATEAALPNITGLAGWAQIFSTCGIGAVLAWLLVKEIPQMREKFAKILEDERAASKNERDAWREERNNMLLQFTVELGKERSACDKRHEDSLAMTRAMHAENKALHTQMLEEMKATRHSLNSERQASESHRMMVNHLMGVKEKTTQVKKEG